MQHHEPECWAEKLVHCLQRHSKGLYNQNMAISTVCSKLLVTKLGIVMHHYEPGCHAKRMVCYFQGQGQNKSSYDQNLTISTISSELLILLLPNLG